MTRVDGVAGAQAIQSSGSGSIPASTLHFWFGQDDDAMELVKQFHYSHRWPSNVQMVNTAHEVGGLFGNKGAAVAASVFSIPGTRWSEDVLELSRLVRREGRRVPLSALIAASCRKLRQQGEWDLLVSFADAQRHHGGVYQACGWNYHGLRKPAMEGVRIDGQFVPGRSANSRYGTRSPLRLAERGIQAEAVWDEGKHLFWKALARSGQDKAQRLGLQQSAYHKPASSP